jgi:single-stranded-DNA-specific exonuclease
MNEAQPRAAIDPLKVSDHSRLFNLDPVIIQILHSRGFDTPEKIDSFLNPQLSGTHSPFLIDGMHDAVARFRMAIESDQKIGIFADSDLDGITSLAIIHMLLSRMKKEPFIRYLKNDENYGLTREIIDEFKSNGVQLMITVDSGTRDIAEIAYARSLGLDVIVTDHHEQDTDLPDAIILNPKKIACGYPCKNLAGVGVAFKLCLAILMSYQPSYNKFFIIISESVSGNMLSVIFNGIVQETRYCPDFQGIIDAIRQIGAIEGILVYDDPSLVELLSANFMDKRIYDLADFIKRIVKIDFSSIDNLIETSAALDLNDHEKSSFLNSIFLEAQMTGSDKITEFINTVLGFVAIGSVADVIPLVGENRLLVKRGIEILKIKKTRPSPCY